MVANEDENEEMNNHRIFGRLLSYVQSGGMSDKKAEEEAEALNHYWIGVLMINIAKRNNVEVFLKNTGQDHRFLHIMRKLIARSEGFCEGATYLKEVYNLRSQKW